MSENIIYFRDGKLIAESGDARVYKMDDELFLEIGRGHTLWTLESEIYDYMEQLQDFPRGDMLEIGLGLGVASRYLLTFPQAKSLTTVEINPDVIDVNKKIKESERGLSLSYNPKKHLILNADGLMYAYQTNRTYDFIFLDFYDRIDEDTLPAIADMTQACRRLLKRGGKIMGWLDKYTSGSHFSTFSHILSNYE